MIVDPFKMYHQLHHQAREASSDDEKERVKWKFKELRENPPHSIGGFIDNRVDMDDIDGATLEELGIVDLTKHADDLRTRESASNIDKSVIERDAD